MEGNTHKCVAEEGSRDLFCCRAPHGARGLKHGYIDVNYTVMLSRPAWGAWIETDYVRIVRASGLVAPRMGRVD